MMTRCSPLWLLMIACGGSTADDSTVDQPSTGDTESSDSDGMMGSPSADSVSTSDTANTLPSYIWREAFPTPQGVVGSLSGVWGTGPNDVFVVGGSDRATQMGTSDTDGILDRFGEIYHYDGTDWTQMAVPDGTDLLVWAYGFAPNDVYAVGRTGSGLHYNGTEWRPLADVWDDIPTDEDLWGIWGTAPDDMWLVGGCIVPGSTGGCNVDLEPQVIHWDGTSFTAYPTPSPTTPGVPDSEYALKVWGVQNATGGHDVYVIGHNGLLMKFNEDLDAFERIQTSLINGNYVAMWGTTHDNLAIVGAPGDVRTITTFDGTTWVRHEPGLGGDLLGVFMDDPAEVVVGGDGGALGRFNIATSTLHVDLDPSLFSDEVSFLASTDIHAMWGDGAGRYYAVAGNFVGGDQRGRAIVREPVP